MNVKKILLTESQLSDRVTELARRISADYAGAPPVIVGILKGSFVFISDLVRKLELDASVFFMEVSSYGASTKTSGIVQIVRDLDESIEGRDVLIVEDIIDSGLTLNYIKSMLSARNPGSVRICAMLNKAERRECDIEVDYVGFDIPNEFVVGYGLDYAERYRQLPYVGVLGDE